MRKLVGLLMALFIHLPIAQNQHLLITSNNTGFENFPFGEPIENYPDLVLKEKFGNLHYYVNPSDEVKLGNIPLASIIYCFYKDKLTKVLLNTTDAESSDGVLVWLKNHYGEGMRSYKSKQAYHWNTNKIEISYIKNTVTGKAIISITSNSVHFL